ncbi:MAG TPA: bifunctional shikimate kinase/3-dehydroquinate synthase [Candidatus Limnocylindrales bacterium]|nr:bifunctional shikimate kinase/3-dehydroquinate synthase [Candidatus Limnocylindrales bacterium]
MDVVLVGLPGSGKTAIGRRLAARHGAVLVDTDSEVEREAGLTIAQIFEVEGEDSFRHRDQAVVERIGGPTPGPAIQRVIATGGGTTMDPRNRWRLYRGRAVIWLDARPEAAAQRLRRSPFVRPLVQGPDPVGAVRALAAARARFYGAAGARVNALREIDAVLDEVDVVARRIGVPAGTVLLRAETSIGRIVIGDGIAATEIGAALDRLGASRAIVVTEPVAWAAVGDEIRTGLEAAGRPLEVVTLPSGEAAKTLATIEAGARELARRRVERSELIVAVGGGALTDAAGFLAATYLRGVPVIHVPTTLAGQVDAAIGGKSAVDLPEGKNLVGAFHQPDSVVIDLGLAAALPERQRRAALAESVKAAALGEARLFDVLEADGPSVAAGDLGAVADGAVADVVERTAWAKVEVVTEDEREAGGRIALNLGHSVGHALETAAGHGTLLHGEAVGYGLRAATRIGVARGATPADRARRIEALLDRLELGVDPLGLDLDEVIGHLAVDKKTRGGRLRWVLPTAEGHVVDADVPAELVRSVAAEVIAGTRAVAGAERAR